MDRSITEQDLVLILDCNLWIKMLTGRNPEFTKIFQLERVQIILTSYIAVEILRSLKRLAPKQSLAFTELESLFWSVCSTNKVVKSFEYPLSETLIAETKQLFEYRIIARLLDLEVKDVPYIVASFQYNAILISDDIRSLVNKREKIQAELNIAVMSSDEFLNSLI